jgi:hypothetical protein
MAALTPRTRSSGVLETFAAWMPSGIAQTMSVNVPPMSMPIAAIRPSLLSS